MVGSMNLYCYHSIVKNLFKPIVDKSKGNFTNYKTNYKIPLIRY